MSNTSATGGYLAPTSTPGGAQNDQALRRLLQPVITGLLDIPGDLVRPRWQPNPPDTPEEDVTWAAVGTPTKTPDSSAAILHSGSQSLVTRDEVLTVLCTFYGPNSETLSEQFSLGMWLSQNREKLTLAGYGLQDVGPSITVPELVNEKWRYGYNVELTLRRKQAYNYAIEDLTGAQFVPNIETLPADTITVEE